MSLGRTSESSCPTERDEGVSEQTGSSAPMELWAQGPASPSLGTAMGSMAGSVPQGAESRRAMQGHPSGCPRLLPAILCRIHTPEVTLTMFNKKSVLPLENPLVTMCT